MTATIKQLCLTTTAAGLLSYASAQPVQFDCDSFSDVTRVGSDEGITLVKSFIETNSEAGYSFDNECISQAVKRNYIEVTELMIQEYFSKEPQRASQAESTARNTIDQVRSKQNDLLIQFEKIPKSIPVISPAFHWAQSLTHTYLQVKYSTRFDSPACLDIFDQEFRLEEDGKQIYLKAMCRNDKKLLKYELVLDLWDQVLTTESDSYLEESSVGRVNINLAKVEQPSKWKKLLANGANKPLNMGVWWELWEKYEEELNKHAPDDDDDEDEDGQDGVMPEVAETGDGAEESNGKQKKKGSKSKRGKKKEKKAKKAEDGEKGNSSEAGADSAIKEEL